VTILDAGGSLVSDPHTISVPLATTGAKLPVFTAGTPFQAQLLATFTDGTPIPSGTNPLTFYTATVNWGDGLTSSTADGTVLALALGNLVGVAGNHNYTKPSPRGLPYIVTVNFSDGAGSKATAATTATVKGPGLLQVLGNALGLGQFVVEGQPFTDQVATFTADSPAAPQDFTAVINWGDGKSSPGTITAGPPDSNGNPTFFVAGTHVYDEDTPDSSSGGGSSSSFTITITNADGSSSLSATAPVTVSDAPLTGEEATLFLTEGVPPSQPLVVATFIDAAPVVPGSSSTATVDWGDGTTSTVVPMVQGTSLAGTTYVVMDTHTYNDDDISMEVENYQIVVTIDDSGGSSTVVLSQANVADPVIFDPPVNFNAVEGAAFSGVVSTLSATSPLVMAGDFTATIDWGDGQVTPGTVVADGPQQFKVLGTHTFEKVGGLPVTVTVHDKEGDTITDNSTATVVDAKLSVQALPVSVARRKMYQGTVARFTDADPGAVAGNFTVKITWGDGTTTGGSVVSDGRSATGATFLVNAGHRYTARGRVPIGITVLDSGGSQASAATTAAVGEPVRALRNHHPHARGHSTAATHPGGPLDHFKDNGTF
jgi:hypothetical protein